MEKNNRIGYNDLTIGLKISTILAYVVGIIYTIAFVTGIVIGAMGLI